MTAVWCTLCPQRLAAPMLYKRAKQREVPRPTGPIAVEWNRSRQQFLASGTKKATPQRSPFTHRCSCSSTKTKGAPAFTGTPLQSSRYVTCKRNERN